MITSHWCGLFRCETKTNKPKIPLLCCPVQKIRIRSLLNNQLECRLNSTWYLVTPEELVQRLFHHQLKIPYCLKHIANELRPHGPINYGDDLLT